MVLWVAQRIFNPMVYRTGTRHIAYACYQGPHTSTAYQVAIANLAVRCSIEQRYEVRALTSPDVHTPHPTVAKSGSVLIARPKMLGVAPEYTQIKLTCICLCFVFYFILFVMHALVSYTA